MVISDCCHPVGAGDGAGARVSCKRRLSCCHNTENDKKESITKMSKSKDDDWQDYLDPDGSAREETLYGYLWLM